MTRYWLKGTGVLVVLAGFVVGLSRSAEAQMPDVPATSAGAFDARSFLPWPPTIPDPHPFLPVPPPGTPPFLPPIGPADADWWTTASDPPPVLQDLARFIATLERTRDLLARWAGDGSMYLTQALGYNGVSRAGTAHVRPQEATFASAMEATDDRRDRGAL